MASEKSLVTLFPNIVSKFSVNFHQGFNSIGINSMSLMSTQNKYYKNYCTSIQKGQQNVI